MKIYVDISYLLFIREELNKINRVPLTDIIFIENGKPLKIPEKRVEEFELMGLNNTDFITSNFYKCGFTNWKRGGAK